MVETTGGRLKGFLYEGAYIYRGVPYAYADRFQMPEETSWEGVKDATSYGFVCPLMNQDTPSAELMVPHRYWPQDEHCQNLNIWTKSLDKEAKNRWWYGCTAADILPDPPLSRLPMTGITCAWTGMWLWFLSITV